MKFKILHENKTRMRFHVIGPDMTSKQADILAWHLQSLAGVSKVKVHERINNATIEYMGDRQAVIDSLRNFRFEKAEVPTGIVENSGRELANTYKEKIVNMIVFHYARKWFLPYPLRYGYTIWRAAGYVWKGLKSLAKRKLEVSVLDATAITVSILRSDINTASTTMFMLGIGELLEDWTHKKSVADLARTMSLNVSSVWLQTEGGQVQVPVNRIQKDDRIVVHAGNVIPFDGIASAGEAMVNQASLTGESVAVRKAVESAVYAGTTIEEGELTIRVTSVGGSSRYEKIVAMIEDTEKLKSSVESQAEHLADRLVPYCLGGTALTYLLTGNAVKALAVLMVDYSCALKLAMPVTVLSSIREASDSRITVKGGKYLEAVAEADTIVFDKTGTLTKAQPTVAQVVSFNGESEDSLLRVAACLEEHFPHSMAKAVVQKAKERNLVHDEMHSKVEYIVAHGIASRIDDSKVIVGSAHFVFEDEHCVIPEDKRELFDSLPEEYSHLYMAVDGVLSAVICVADPLREEAKGVVKRLQDLGLKVVMMTGDSDRTAKAIAAQLQLDEYYSEVLPEDKAGFVEREKAAGRKVLMIGDGINDSPALSAADAGIAISDGAELAREIADITIGAEDLREIVLLKMLSDALMKRIHSNYRKIIGFNTLLIALGIGGVIQPTTSALLHNTSTLLIGMEGMTNLLDEKKILGDA
ncbi:MAG: heavy metal translocating P-type ATPase [Lachnospiraceae bacterium]|nr:heavy metal translocating P-type ATPase [Lachnospiraceae bacterium]